MRESTDWAPDFVERETEREMKDERSARYESRGVNPELLCCDCGINVRDFTHSRPRCVACDVANKD